MVQQKLNLIGALATGALLGGCANTSSLTESLSEQAVSSGQEAIGVPAGADPLISDSDLTKALASDEAAITDLSCAELRQHLCYERARRILAVAELDPLGIAGDLGMEGATKALTSLGGSLIPGGGTAKLLGDQVLNLKKKQDYKLAVSNCDAEYGEPEQEDAKPAQ